MVLNLLKSKIKEKSYNTRLFFRGVYLDILRFIFSRWFIRNRMLFIALTMTPIMVYGFMYESQHYEQLLVHRSTKKHYVAEKLLHERGLADFDDDTYAHYSNYMKWKAPR